MAARSTQSLIMVSERSNQSHGQELRNMLKPDALLQSFISVRAGLDSEVNLNLLKEPDALKNKVWETVI